MLICVLTGCSTTRHVATQPTPPSPPWQTWCADKVQASIEMDGQTMQVSGSVQAVYDSIISISVKPILGIEVFRIEATKKELVVTDRIGLRYTHPTYTYLNTVIRPNLSLKSLQEWLTLQESEQAPALTYKAAGHTFRMSIEAKQIERDVPVRITPLRTETYQEQSVTEFIKNL